MRLTLYRPDSSLIDYISNYNWNIKYTCRLGICSNHINFIHIICFILTNIPWARGHWNLFCIVFREIKLGSSRSDLSGSFHFTVDHSKYRDHLVPFSMSAKKFLCDSNTDCFIDVQKELSPQGSPWSCLNARVGLFLWWNWNVEQLLYFNTIWFHFLKYQFFFPNGWIDLLVFISFLFYNLPSPFLFFCI